MSEITLQLEPGTPARMDGSHTARILGVSEHDIPTLVRKRLLKPVGDPVPSAAKYFATCEIIRLANDIQWLDRAQRAISQYWRTKNSNRLTRTSSRSSKDNGS